MPKKKRFRKAAKQKKGEVLEVGPTDPENMENLSEGKVVNSSGENKVSEGETSKKKFGFSHKRKSHLNGTDVSQKKGTESKTHDGVQRSNSLSLHNESKSKIPLPRFRTLQPKKKNSSASCSAFETTSMVLNPGMDDWRMSGLLNTVEKSNSMLSLGSPVRGVVTEKKPETPTSSNTESVDTVTHDCEATTPIQSETGSPSMEHIEVVSISDAPASPSTEKTTKDEEDNISEKFLETDIDFDMHIAHDTTINETIIEEGDEDTDKQTKEEPSEQPCTNSESSVSTNNSPKHAESVKVESLANNGVNCEAKTNSIEVVHEEEMEVYDLDDELVVVIRNLEYVVEENHIDMPKEVESNDWLILNLSQRVIETC